MITYDEALYKILEKISVLGVVESPLLSCLGSVAAEDIYTDLSLPMLDISGPDGYAVRSQDIKMASKDRPAILSVTGTARAGCMPKKAVKPGTAMRIMTGSAVPKGADCIVRFEDTDEPQGKNGPNPANPGQVKIYVPGEPGMNIQPPGSHVREGTLVLKRGAVIGPAQISALAAIGKTWTKVIRRPFVSILATGDELVTPGKRLTPGKAYNCNTAAMTALVHHYGGVPRVLGMARDNERSVHAKIERGLEADAIITTGGVSMGDYDLVRLMLGKMGKVVFSRIKMGPGAAVAFGFVKRPSYGGSDRLVPLFALNFETLVRPALLKMRGLQTTVHPWVEAAALDPVHNKKPITFVKWTHLTGPKDNYRVEFVGVERMGSLASLAMANSLTIIPENTVVRAGDRVRVLPLDWGGYGNSL